jgi:hypothetical protein
VATVRFGKLDRNAHRRAQCWIARQPIGPEHPILRLRSGRWREERAYDFLDVATPRRHHDRDDSAYVWAQRMSDRLAEVVGHDAVSGLPGIGFSTVLCAHYGRSEVGASTIMAAFPDGRNAVYASDL